MPCWNGGERWIALGQSPEPAYRALMVAHGALGDRSKVAAVWERCAQSLRDDLGVEPCAQTRALFEQLTKENSLARAETLPSPRPISQARVTNLPVPWTSFIGRVRESDEVKQLLSTTRLLTLTGSGGVGKTRLAIRAATELVHEFEDGVRWVDLAALTDAALIPQQVAKSLGVREIPPESLSETLANYLCSKRMLLVLDNCEHLVSACAQFIESLLSACPNTRILATSREALGILGEVVWRVPSLAVPDLQMSSPSEAWMSYEGIRLFVERATAKKPGFGLTKDNAQWIAQICRRLDGIPLAIELAAARVQVLTPEQIAARLDDRFNLLTSGNRAGLLRHQTLRTLTDWSYDLLSEPERVLLRRLSVFAGGFTLEAAEAVCAEDHSTAMKTGIGPAEALGLLSQLIAKSLVGVEQRDAEVRYSLLETIRQYAHDRLLQAGEIEKARNLHLGFFLRLAEENELKRIDAEQTIDWLDRVEAEYDNLLTALHWAEESQAGGAALRLVYTLSTLWEMRGYVSEARERLAAVLSMPTVGEPTWAYLRAITLCNAGHLALLQADYIAGKPLLQEGLAIFKELGERKWVAISLSRLWSAAWTQGDHTSAQELAEENLAIRRELGDKRGIAAASVELGLIAREVGDYAVARSLTEKALSLRRELGHKQDIAFSLMDTGATAHAQGDPAASALLEESLTIFQSLGDKLNVACCLHDLGAVAARQGDQMLARSRFTTSLGLFREVRDRRNLIKCLEGLAGVSVTEGRVEKAARLFGASEALREALGTPLPGSYRANYERNLSIVREQLDEASVAATWAEGRAMTMEQAIAYALAEPETNERRPVPSPM